MNFVLFGLPVSLWYWRASLRADSTDSRAARGEEDAVEVARGERGDLRGELDRPRVGVGPGREEAELLGLVGAGLRDVGAAVPDVHAEERAERVEVAVAVLVPDVAAVALDDHRDLGAAVVGAHPAEVQPEVALGQRLVVDRRRCGRLRRHQSSLFSTLSDRLVDLDNSWLQRIPADLPPRSIRCGPIGRGGGWRSRASGRGGRAAGPASAERGAGVSAERDDHEQEGDALEGDADRGGRKRVVEDEDPAGDAADAASTCRSARSR